MRTEHFVYHEIEHDLPYKPQEDVFNNFENIFVVADGITHDLQNNLYPTPSDSAEVARIVCQTFIDSLKNTDRELENIRNAFGPIRKAVYDFNVASELYRDRESNGYSIGAAVFALVIIKQGKLLYAVLGDCFFSIFSDDLKDHPILRSYVDETAAHFLKGKDWDLSDTRKMWRKDLRNRIVETRAGKFGYGAVDGSEGFEQFVQMGEEPLQDGDLICLYSDGFIKAMSDNQFISKIKESKFSVDILKYISDYTLDKGLKKEKTGCFIRYSE